MKNTYEDQRIVMTLDAGGTNLVFSALQAGKEIIKPIKLPANPTDLKLGLTSIIEGFKLVETAIVPNKPVAISFAFPGPADYEAGIIGDLPNYSSFRSGVALGPMLEGIFGIPTFINNDGDLFAYGESVAGFLPYINELLRKSDIDKSYKNLIGITLGTGFGAGIVVNNQICRGDNSAGGEIWLTRNHLHPDLIAEESVSIRGIQGVYALVSGDRTLQTPSDIYRIAKGEVPGDKDAAVKAFEELAIVAGESLAHAITLLDAPVVIGGGIAGAAEFIVPKIVKHLQSTIEGVKGRKFPRVISNVFDLDNPASVEDFVSNSSKRVIVPFSEKLVTYNEKKRIPIGLSKLGTSKAINLGAYTLALNNLDRVRV